MTATERELLQMLAHQVEDLLRLRRNLKRKQNKIKLLTVQVQSLDRSNNLKDQLLAVLSHDLRSPLISFRSVIELLAAQALEPEELEILIPEVCNKFDQTEMKVMQMLQWAQQQLQTEVVPIEMIKVEAIAAHVLPWCQDCAQRKNVTLQVEMEPQLQVLGNLELIGVVLRNFLGNAVKYSRHGETITLFARRSGQYVELGVRDTGLGMKPETLKKIRSHSYQLSAPGTDNEKGTGLGYCSVRLTSTRWALP